MALSSDTANGSMMLFHCRYMAHFSHKSKQCTSCHVGSEVTAETTSVTVHGQLLNEARVNDNILPLQDIGMHIYPQSCTCSMLHIMSVASE